VSIVVSILLLYIPDTIMAQKPQITFPRGRSLMDWIKVCNQVPQPKSMRPVTIAELRAHATESDAWMSLRGVVYDVTYYMSFHPGGASQVRLLLVVVVERNVRDSELVT
jgi:hypothetical protein